MARQPLDEQIDRLYQLTLDEFTAGRNALAKELGSGAPDIKRLEKPNAPAWAVNQLYWRQRKVYDALIATAEKLRAAYRLQLAGKSADVRALETAHRDTVRQATQAAREILEAGGGKASDAVMEAVRETLDVLPGSDRPGRLTKALKRTGFEALQGFAIAPGLKPVKPKAEPPAKAPARAPAEDRQHAMNKERLRFAEAAEREAEAALERTRRAVERAERVRERIEGELEEAVKSEQQLRKEEAARKAAHEKAVSERERLAQRLS